MFPPYLDDTGAGERTSDTKYRRNDDDGRSDASSMYSKGSTSCGSERSGSARLGVLSAGCIRQNSFGMGCTRRESYLIYEYHMIVAEQRAKVYPRTPNGLAAAWVGFVSRDSMQTLNHDNGGNRSTYLRDNTTQSTTSTIFSHGSAPKPDRNVPLQLPYSEPHFEIFGIKALRFQDTVEYSATPSTALSDVSWTKPLLVATELFRRARLKLNLHRSANFSLKRPHLDL